MGNRMPPNVQAQQRTLSESSSRDGLLQRTCACGQHTIAGGECDTCRSKRLTLRHSQKTFDPSSAPDALPAGPPAQEQDTSPDFTRASRIGYDFSQVPIHASDGGVIQTKGGQASDTGQSTVPPIVHDVLRSPGQPLDPATRAFMEPRFGHNLGHVRIHTDDQAAKSARAVNARAYTVRGDIVFDHDRFVPDTPAGKRLLAHELTHIVQQRGSEPAVTLPWSQPGDRFEREATKVADLLIGQSAGLAQINERSTAPMLSRDNASETAAVLRTGTARNTGLQFFPRQITSTRIGPVSGEGGLVADSTNRLSVIVSQTMTLRRLAGLLLPLWNSASPFTAPGSAAPVDTPLLTADVLAQGLLVYNRSYLGVGSQPTPSMTTWKGGLRFPLPIEIDESGQGVVNRDLIQNLASEFNATWKPLLDRPAPAVTAQSADDLRQSVATFLGATPDANERGSALLVRAITNPVEAKPFVVEVINQLGGSRFEVALAFMDSSVNSQIALLASQPDGVAILRSIFLALGASPATLSPRQQESLTRANRLLKPILGWNFSPGDFARLQQGGKDLTIASDSGFFPAKLQDNLLKTLAFVLGTKISPPATEGVNAFDFFHGHLVVKKDPAIAKQAKAAQAKEGKIQSELSKERARAFGGKTSFTQGYPLTPGNIDANQKAVEKILPSFGTLLDEAMKLPGAAVMYHTFEFNQPSDLKAKGEKLGNENPRRHYVTPLDSNQPTQYTPPSGGTYEKEYIHITRFSFLVDDKGAVHVRPMSTSAGFTTLELSTITGTTFPEPLDIEK